MVAALQVDHVEEDTTNDHNWKKELGIVETEVSVEEGVLEEASQGES